MKKIGVLVLVFAMLSVGAPAAADPGTLYVDPSGSDSNDCASWATACATINGAIGKATAGDTIYVAAGTYDLLASKITVDKSVRLLGAQADVDPRPSKGGRGGPESIIVSSGEAVRITAPNVEFNGFTVESHITSSSYNAVYAYNAGNPQIRYNIVYNTTGGPSNEGIKVRGAGDAGAVVEYNYVYDIPSPGDSINFDGVNNGSISYNEVRNGGSENAAIYVYGSLNTTIECNLVDTTTQNDGIKLGTKGGGDATKSGGSIVGNTVLNTKQDGITVYMSDVLVESNKVSGSTSENGAIYLAFGISNVTVRYNEVHDNTLTTSKWGDPGAIMIGTAVNASTVHVNHNNIYGNSPNGVTNKATAPLDATKNWWGDASGPSGAGSGSGDAVSTNVDFSSWLSAAEVILDPCAPPDNQGPITSDVGASPNPAMVGSEVTLTANVDDSTTGNSTIASAECSLNGGAWTAMAAQDGAFDQVNEDVTATFTAPATPGVYDLCVRGTDAVGNLGDPACIPFVAYDPSAGFVTGGGWIDSPVNANYPYMQVGGKANFGFVAKYKKGAAVPGGNTQFKAGDLNFHSTSYQWLVVNQNDSRAQFKGYGTINGAGNFGFMIWARDSSPDTFRIKIWNGDDESNVVYDNGTDQAIGGGSIVIHK